MTQAGEPAADPSADPFAGPGWTHRAPGWIRVRRRRKGRPRRWRRAAVGGGLFVLTVVAGAAWLLYDGLHARDELQAARADVQTLRAQVSAGDLSAARLTARSLQRHADAAYGYATSPVWSVADHLPGVGDQLTSVRTVTAVVHSLAVGALPQLIDAAGVLDPSALRGPDGSIDTAAISRAAPALQAAARTLTRATASLAAMPRGGWASVSSARTSLLAQLPALSRTVASAHQAAVLAPPLLGADGPRRYMITFENDAEMRATGGMPGAFAVLLADHGKLSFTNFEPDDYLIGTTAQGVDFGADYNALYGTGFNGAHTEYRNSNLSPNYPYAAQLWLGMWRHKTGQQLDGAFALDPTALSYLLGASGPAALPDGTAVTAGNVVALTQSTVYSKFSAPNSAARKTYLLEIAKAVAHRLLAPGTSAAALVRAAGKAAGESRLLFWTRDTAAEQTVSTLPLGGVEPHTADPYFRLALWNSTGSKLDYYLHTALAWTSSGCGPRRRVTVRVTIRNDAPAGLPPYVLGATADKQFGIPLGDEYLAVMAYGTAGSRLDSYTVDGRPVEPGQFSELGHPVWSDGQFVPRGKTLTVVYQLTEPGSAAAPIVPAQPMVNPMQVTVRQGICN